MKKYKSLVIMLNAVCLALTFSPVTAFARVDPEVVEEEIEIVPPEPVEEVEEPMGPMTPEGNLTIIDDYGDPDKSGKRENITRLYSFSRSKCKCSKTIIYVKGR